MFHKFVDVTHFIKCPYLHHILKSQNLLLQQIIFEKAKGSF